MVCDVEKANKRAQVIAEPRKSKPCLNAADDKNIVSVIIAVVLLNTMFKRCQRERKSLIGKLGTVTSVEPATGIVAATALSQKH